MSARLLTALALASTGTACADLRDQLGDDDAAWSGWTDADPREVSRATVRVATWNVENLGAEGSDEWIATRDVLARLDADVVGLNEVSASDMASLEALASDLGYPFVALPGAQPFGDIGNAVLARVAEPDITFPTSAALSGDSQAQDVTRLPGVVSFAMPTLNLRVSVVSVHLKSGELLSDGFRRVIDARRAVQAASTTGDDALLLMGDMNEDVLDIDPTEPRQTDVPSDLPSSFRLGQDMSTLIASEGLAPNPFGEFEAAGFGPLDAAQRDADRATRPISGRRIDYFLGNDVTRHAVVHAEVYDSADDALAGIAKGGTAPASDATTAASDHLPMVADITLYGE